MHKVFVYGTLKKGFSNNSLLEGATFIEEMKTHPNYVMVDLGAFPGVVPFFGEASTPIHGELYEVDDTTFGRLDMLEGYPSFYNRQRIATPHGAAWMYVLPDKYLHTHPIITSGKWDNKRRYF